MTTSTENTSHSVLVIGGGGREHCLALHLAKSKGVTKVYCCPGNGGTDFVDAATGATVMNVSLDLTPPEFDSVCNFCVSEKIDLVVVGPEQPLCDGMVDSLRSRNVRCFGPDKKAAQLEASKAFSKAFMQRNGIPTAEFKTFKKAELSQALEYADTKWNKEGKAVVVKVSGLAAGKGVIVAESCEEAKEAIERCLVKEEFGEAGSEVVIEEKLIGPELSVLALSDGINFVALPAVQDHKRAFDGDKGPNSGGMGAICPVPLATLEVMEDIRKNILVPTIGGMNREGRPFVGCLFVGIMLTADGPKTLEYNVRFGDPESQAVIPLLETDLYTCMAVCLEGRLKELDLKIKKNLSSAAVVVASGGYPGPYSKGHPIKGLDEAAKLSMVFHAGTSHSTEGRNGVVTAGGRVLTVTATGRTIPEAREKAYTAVRLISFEGAFYRSDIGAKW